MTRSPLRVERVVKLLPHEHFTVVSLYAGWMSVFMAISRKSNERCTLPADHMPAHLPTSGPSRPDEPALVPESVDVDGFRYQSGHPVKGRSASATVAATTSARSTTSAYV